MSAKSSFHRRAELSVLVITHNTDVNSQIRQTLQSLGYGSVSFANTHSAGIQKIKDRNFSAILFDSKESDLSARSFVEQTVTWDENVVLIALSFEPQIDDVFGLLAAGARGFVVLPFNVDSIDQAIIRALDGPQFSDAVLFAPDRNAALVALVLNNLYKLSVVMRQVREFPSASRDIARYRQSFNETMNLARMFCKGGLETLKEAVITECISRGQNAATRLGRTRKKLQRARTTGEKQN